jgi:very-short-patch-repair endonuclease
MAQLLSALTLSPLSLWERARVRGFMKGGLTPEHLAFVRQLRRDQTKAEKLLWCCLRNRQLFGLKFRRQYPCGSYILDFYCHEHKLCIELDGGQHYESTGIQHDEQRQAFLISYGIYTLRFSNSDVLQHLEAVLLQIAEAVKPLTPTLSQRERE